MRSTAVSLRRQKSIHKRGFTLIELLVVIFIIGILSAIIFPRLNAMREKARDTQRITDVRDIQNALERYFNKNGKYPQTNDLGTLDNIKTEDPMNESYGYKNGTRCDGSDGGYNLTFIAENPKTFANDTSLYKVSRSTSKFCVNP